MMPTWAEGGEDGTCVRVAPARKRARARALSRPPATYKPAVHGVNCALRGVALREAHEAAAARHARLAVHEQLHLDELAKARKEVAQLALAQLLRQLADEKFIAAAGRLARHYW